MWRAYEAGHAARAHLTCGSPLLRLCSRAGRRSRRSKGGPRAGQSSTARGRRRARRRGRRDDVAARVALRVRDLVIAAAEKFDEAEAAARRIGDRCNWNQAVSDRSRQGRGRLIVVRPPDVALDADDPRWRELPIIARKGAETRRDAVHCAVVARGLGESKRRKDVARAPVVLGPASTEPQPAVEAGP